MALDLARRPAGVAGGNTGHGHVWKRPDGLVARCGGPALCAECARDAAQGPQNDGARRPSNIVGIDPGLSGALALYAGGNCVTVEDLPIWYAKRGKKTARKIDTLGLQRILNLWADNVAIGEVYVEAVHTMPKQGIVSSGQLMEAFGAIQACVLCVGLPLVLVDPATWKAATGLPGKHHKDAERIIIRRAAMAFPRSAEAFARLKDHNRAEAALLARYGFNLRYGKGVENVANA